jgi:hypothetical protein
LSKAWTRQELQDANDRLAYLEKLPNTMNVNADERIRIKLIAGKYNVNIDECMAVPGTEMFDCILTLELVMRNAIRTAKSLNRATLLSKQKDLKTQLNFHRNNLVALGCNSSIAATGNWNGTFADSYGSITISGTGSTISATFTSQGPENNWKNVGQWSECTVNGNKATCKWTCSYSDNDKTGTRKGTVEVTLNGNSISGSYREDTPSFTWKPGIDNKYTKMQKDAVWPFNMKRR